MINYEAIEDALFAAVKASTGYAEENIIFDSQNGVSPAPTPYATIFIGDLMRVGQDAHWRDYDAARPAGAEIVRVSSGLRMLPVKFAFFSPMSDTDPTGRIARSAGSKMEADLSLESIRTPLNNVGLGILKIGDARWIPKINNTDFEARVVLEVRFVVPHGSSDTVGWIEHVKVTPTIDGVVLPVIEIDAD